MLDLNLTLLLTSLIIFILTFVLERIFVRPIGTIINEREKIIRFEQKKLENLQIECDRLTTRIEENLKKARQQAAQRRLTILQDAEKKREEFLNQVRLEAETYLKSERENIEAQKSRVQQELQAEVTSILNELKEALRLE